MNLNTGYWARYYALGWSLIPIQPGIKRPFHGLSWKKYQDVRPSMDQLERWAQTWPKSGIAVLTGSISGVVVLDIDKIPDEGSTAQETALAAIARSLIKRLPVTATARTSKGRHLYFKHPGRWIPTKVGFLPGLDVRGDGGYALLPPSVHPSGWVYAWEIPPEEGIADLPPELEQAINDADTYVRSLTGTSGPLLENGPLGTWRAAVNGVTEGNADGTPGRNQSAAQVIGKLLHDTDTELWELQWEAIKQWNRRNSPPLDEKELRVTFDSIAKKEATNRKPKRTYEVFDLSDLQDADLPPQPAAVENLVSGLTVLVAKPKVGKSQLAIQIALDVIQGRPLWPQEFPWGDEVLKWPVQAGPVLYLDLEDSQRRARDRAKTMNGGTIPKGFHIALQAPTVKENGVAWLQQRIEELQPKLVIIDMLPTFIGTAGQGGKGVYQSEYLTMRMLWELSASTQVPILALQHARKDPVGKGVHPDPFDSANGTLGGPGAADTIIILQQRSLRGPRTIGTKAATISVRGRDVPEYELSLIGNPRTKSWSIEA